MLVAEFAWPSVYERSRCCDESLVNLGGLISPSSSTSDGYERKVKCEQLSPAAPVATAYDASTYTGAADRKPNAEQLRLSLKSEVQHRRHEAPHDGEDWAKLSRVSAATERRGLGHRPWISGGRAVAFESRGTSPLVEHQHSEHQSNGRQTPPPAPLTRASVSSDDAVVPTNLVLVKVPETSQDKAASTNIDFDGDRAETDAANTSGIEMVAASATRTNATGATQDLSADSAIDLSLQSSETSTVSADEHRDDDKLTEHQHSHAIDIPTLSADVSISTVSGGNPSVDEEVGSILCPTSTAVAAVAESATTRVAVSTNDCKADHSSTSTGTSGRFPVNYELERITPVDEEEMPAYPPYGIYQPILNLGCVAPLDGSLSSVDQSLAYAHLGYQQVPVVAASQYADVSGLDILSTIASQRPTADGDAQASCSGVFTMPAAAPAPASALATASVPAPIPAPPPSRRFSILDLPLSQFMTPTSESPSLETSVDSAYNAPTLQCFINDGDDDVMKTGDANGAAFLIGQTRIPPLMPIDTIRRTSSESSEPKAGDVFTSLKVDCGTSVF